MMETLLSMSQRIPSRVLWLLGAVVGACFIGLLFFLNSFGEVIDRFLRLSGLIHVLRGFWLVVCLVTLSALIYMITCDCVKGWGRRKKEPPPPPTQFLW